MSANEKLIKLIEAMVRKEVKEQLPKLVPQVVKEVMSNMILESKTTIPTPTYSNSDKRRSLQENYRDDSNDFEDYPTMGARPKTSMDLSSMVGWDGDTPPGQGVFQTPDAMRRSNDIITVDAAMSETGNQIPIRPEQIPEGILKAFNKNYGPVLDRLNITKKNNG
jgi:hypothetical protein